MDYLLARITTSKHDNTRLLLSNITTFDNVVVGNSLPYNDERKLQPEEWFCVENFSQKEFYEDKLFNQIKNAARIPIENTELGSIKFLIAVQDNENSYMFQRVFANSRIVQQKGIRYINDYIEMLTIDRMLVINKIPDAIYVKNEDKLLFKEISRIKPIFKGIDILYREATDEEVTSFLNINEITLKNEFNNHKVSVPNRRRISNALTQYNAFTDDEKRTLLTYIWEYCPEIYDNDSSSVQIGTDENLKKIYLCS